MGWEVGRREGGRANGWREGDGSCAMTVGRRGVGVACAKPVKTNKAIIRLEK